MIDPKVKEIITHLSNIIKVKYEYNLSGIVEGLQYLTNSMLSWDDLDLISNSGWNTNKAFDNMSEELKQCIHVILNIHLLHLTYAMLIGKVREDEDIV